MPDVQPRTIRRRKSTTEVNTPDIATRLPNMTLQLFGVYTVDDDVSTEDLMEEILDLCDEVIYDNGSVIDAVLHRPNQDWVFSARHGDETYFLWKAI